MTYDKNWNKWLRQSINQHFKTLLQAENVVFFAEGGRRNTGDLKTFVEIRADGPTSRQNGKEYWITYRVNILIQDNVDTQRYNIDRIQGIVQAGCIESFPAKKWDAGEAILNCFQLMGDVEGHYYGQLEPDLPRLQASVAATYRIILPGI